MAVTAIWPVNGSLANPLNYITQEKKVTQQQELSDAFSPAELQGLLHIMDFQGQPKNRSALENVLGYTVQESKTELDSIRFITGVNCNAASSLEEMQLIKNHYRKNKGVACFHGYQSFAPGEITPELAHTIGVELANRLWGDRYQVVVATHLDCGHLHNHFVLNSVSFADGKKYRGDFHSYDRFRVMSDKLCKEYQLSVIDRPQTGRQPNPKIYEELGEPVPVSNAERIRQDVDAAICCSGSVEQFYSVLKNMGYTFRTGDLKYFTLRAPGAGRSTRLDRRYGDQYTLEGIAARIQKNSSAPVWFSEVSTARLVPNGLEKQSAPVMQKYPLRGKYPLSRKATAKKSHFRRLYLYYCYRFGVIQPRRARCPPVSRKELYRMRSLSEETRLLVANHIDTDRQLLTYQHKCSAELSSLCAQRKQLYNRQRTEGGEALQNEIDLLSAEIKKQRQQLKLCSRIFERVERQAEKEFQHKEGGNNDGIRSCERSREHEYENDR